ncbi:MAG: hypothetical protein SGJ18_06470 [Pseudomonadota bacterium]|nr:hypothetical protein [Pseudomonadota bacterium]
MDTQIKSITQKNDQYFRFQVLQGDIKLEGGFKKTKSVGMAYLKNGQNTYTLRLWTFVNEKFYLIPNKNDALKYLVMTREPNKSPTAKNKYFWNIVGNGVADSALGVIKLDFDLLSKVIYVNIHPELSAFSVKLPEPDFGETAAA